MEATVLHYTMIVVTTCHEDLNGFTTVNFYDLLIFASTKLQETARLYYYLFIASYLIFSLKTENNNRTSQNYVLYLI